MDKLSDDLKLDIFSRLSMKNLGCSMCVSKRWLNLIATSYLPIKFYGIMVREENRSAFSLCLAASCHDFKVGIRLRFPAEFVSKTKWLDYCNGLLLLWHREGKSLPKYYAVLNPLTKQYVTVDIPTPRSRVRDYAVLAYDASRSNYFMIVRFESLTHLKVFFSETGRWVTLLYRLPDLVTKADWVKQCVYFEGALYRLSASGHLLRFELKIEMKSEVRRAKAINLPNEFERSDDVLECLGILNGQLCFSMSDNLKLRIWALLPDEASPVDDSYQWSLKYVISRSSSTVKLFKYSKYEKRVVALHPYLNIVYSAERCDLGRGNGFPNFGSGFYLSDQTSFEVNIISEGGNPARKRIHFHPVVLSLSQFASTKMDNSEGDCHRKLNFY